QLAAEVVTPLSQSWEHVVDAINRPFAGTCDDLQVFLDSERAKDLAFLGDPTQAGMRARVAGYLDDVPAFVDDTALAHPRDPHEGRQQRGLAHAVAPQQGQALAGIEGQRNVLEDRGVPVTRPDVLQAQ